MSDADTRPPSAAADVLVSLGAQVVGAAVVTVAALVAARQLGPSGQGILQLGQSLAGTASQLVAFGVATTAIRMAARRTESIAAVVGTGVAVTAALGAGLVLVALPLAPALSRLLLAPERRDEAVIVLSAALAALYAVQLAMLAADRGRNRFVSYNTWILAGKLANVVALVSALVPGDDRAVRTLVVLVATNGLYTAGLLATVWARYGLSVRDGRRLSARMLRENASAHAGTLVQEVSYRGDVLLLSAIAGTSELGLYAIAIMVAEAMWYLPNSAGLVLLPRAAAQDDPASTARMVSFTSATTAMLAAVAVLVAVAAPFAVPAALGDQYRGAVAPVLWLLPGIVALGSWKVVINHLVGIGMPAAKLHSAVAGAAVILGLDLVLIPPFGAAGAAAASSAGYICSAGVALRAASRALGVPVRALVLTDRAGLQLVRRSLRRVSGGRAAARATPR